MLIDTIIRILIIAFSLLGFSFIIDKVDKKEKKDNQELKSLIVQSLKKYLEK